MVDSNSIFLTAQTKHLGTILVPLSHATSNLATNHIGLIFKIYPEFDHVSPSPVTTLVPVTTSISLLVTSFLQASLLLLSLPGHTESLRLTPVEAPGRVLVAAPEACEMGTPPTQPTLPLPVRSILATLAGLTKGSALVLGAPSSLYLEHFPTR